MKKRSTFMLTRSAVGKLMSTLRKEPLPSTIKVEPSNACMLKCISCPKSNGMRRRKGLMSMETFRLLIGGITWPVSRLNWSFAGEPLTHPRLFDMVRMAADRGILSKVDTNGMLLERFIDPILSSKRHHLNVALEGVTEDVAGKFRIGYDLGSVLRGVRGLCNKRKELKVHCLWISLNYLVKRQNEHQIQDAIKLTREYGADEIIFKSMNLNVGSTLDEFRFQQLANEYLPENPRFLRYEKEGPRWVRTGEQLRLCTSVDNAITVLWDGRVSICCLDYEGEFVGGGTSTMTRSRRYGD